MFVNLSNHPSSNWCDGQLDAAHKFGEIVDFALPSFNEKSTEKEIFELAQGVFEEITQLGAEAVLCVGEYTFVYSFVSLCLHRHANFKVFCTKADVDVHIDKETGNRTIEYNFKEFLEYSAFFEIDRIAQHNLQEMTLNFSQRFPSSCFNPEQIAATPRGAGEIIDDQPLCLVEESNYLAAEKSNIDKVHNCQAKYVILDGEFYTFFANASILLDEGFDVLIKCSARVVDEKAVENGKNVKTTKFKFYQYRNLQIIHKLLEKIR